MYACMRAFHFQGGTIETQKSGCHVIGRRATGQTIDLIVSCTCARDVYEVREVILSQVENA